MDGLVGVVLERRVGQVGEEVRLVDQGAAHLVGWAGVERAAGQVRVGDTVDESRQAEVLYREALTYRAAVPEAARTVERLACLCASAGPDEARVLLADAERMRQAHGAPVPPADVARIEQARPVLAPA